jgi:hypothetical protein
MKAHKSGIIGLLTAIGVALAVASAPTTAAEEQAAGSALANPVATHMPEDVRGTISKVVILPTAGEAGQVVTGSYEKSTVGIQGGMAKGAEIGTIPVEVGGIPVGIPIPILREIGMIAGALSGGAKREIQDFRDALTDDLVDAVDQPLSNDALANDVFWGIRNVSTVQPKILALSTPIPADTDAILYVAVTDLSINVQDDIAIITTTATARLARYGDGTTLYYKEATYEDRDTLSDWTDNDTVLWRQYRTFARHYLGRELSAEVYERIQLNYSLAPLESNNIKRIKKKKSDWYAAAKSLNPTLAWSYELLGGEADEQWLEEVRAADVTWDIEIYDESRPVYRAQNVRGLSHTVDRPLEKCKTYRWTVRPTYTVKGVRKNGSWMRNLPDGATDNGNVGRAASVAHAYIQDFAVLELGCRLK